MVTSRHVRLMVCIIFAALLVASCGSSSTSSSGSSVSGGVKNAPATGSGSVTSSSGSNQALSADAASAGTGDVPDNQNFLTFRHPTAGFSIKFPEGWSQLSTPAGVSFQDKNNLVRVVVASGSAPTTASVKVQLDAAQATKPSLKYAPPTQVTVHGISMVKTTYSTESEPNSVTGKRVTLMVDRYDFGKGGKVVTVELGTPKGVDNVDAFRLMIESFKWI